MNHLERNKGFPLVLLLAGVTLAGGCTRLNSLLLWEAGGPPSPLFPPAETLWTFYAHISAPITTDFDRTPVGSRSGSTTARYFDPCLVCGYHLPLAFDAADIQEAARKGGLQKVYYADYEYLNILRIYRELTVHAYGD